MFDRVISTTLRYERTHHVSFSERSFLVRLRFTILFYYLILFSSLRVGLSSSTHSWTVLRWPVIKTFQRYIWFTLSPSHLLLRPLYFSPVFHGSHSLLTWMGLSKTRHSITQSTYGDRPSTFYIILIPFLGLLKSWNFYNDNISTLTSVTFLIITKM